MVKTSRKNLMYIVGAVAFVALVLFLTRDIWMNKESYVSSHQFARGRVDHLSSATGFPGDVGRNGKHAPLHESRVNFTEDAELVDSGRHMDAHDQYACTQGEYITNDLKTRNDLMRSGDIGLANHLSRTSADAIEVDGTR